MKNEVCPRFLSDDFHLIMRIELNLIETDFDQTIVLYMGIGFKQKIYTLADIQIQVQGK